MYLMLTLWTWNWCFTCLSQLSDLSFVHTLELLILSCFCSSQTTPIASGVQEERARRVHPSPSWPRRTAWSSTTWSNSSWPVPCPPVPLSWPTTQTPSRSLVLPPRRSAKMRRCSSTERGSASVCLQMELGVGVSTGAVKSWSVMTVVNASTKFGDRSIDERSENSLWRCQGLLGRMWYVRGRPKL